MTEKKVKKNPKPLTLLVTDQALFSSEPIQDLLHKGHTIHVGDLSAYDAVIGSCCWRIPLIPSKWATYLTLMLAALRAVKYPKETKDAA